MKVADSSIEQMFAPTQRSAAFAEDDRARFDCPDEYIAAARAAAEQASARAVLAAETRERTRIIRWLRAVSNVYAERSRAGGIEDSAYWLDQFEAFSHAADGIAQRRHVRPH